MKTVQDYRDEISEAQKKIEEIQNSCNHPSHKVVMFSWRVGAYHPSRMCKICCLLISGVTQEESDECWANFNSWEKQNIKEDDETQD